MDTRRFRDHSPSQAFAAVRWLGWVVLMMFVLVQTAGEPYHPLRAALAEAVAHAAQ